MKYLGACPDSVLRQVNYWHRCTERDCTRTSADMLGPLTAYAGDAWPGVLPEPGSYQCEAHKPRECRFCGHWIPWYDGCVCDWCDRYTDEGEEVFDNGDE